MAQPFTFELTQPWMIEQSLDGSERLTVAWIDNGLRITVPAIPPGPLLLQVRNTDEEDHEVVVGVGDDPAAVAAWAHQRPGGEAEELAFTVLAGGALKQALVPSGRFVGVRLLHNGLTGSLTARGLVSRGPSSVRFAETGIHLSHLGF